jgi:putative ABC transport system permease protein
MTNSRSSDDAWLSNSFSTYVLLYPGASPANAEGRLPDMIVKYVGPILQSFLGITIDVFLSQGNKYNMFLQPLVKIHLDPTIEQAMKPANDPKYLLIFGSIGILIIIIAAFNFMNLATAQATRRAKEVGIKKVCGSTREQLMSQFLTESMVLSLVSLILAVIITVIILPYFNNLLEIKMEVDLINNWYTIPSGRSGTLSPGRSLCESPFPRCWPFLSPIGLPTTGCKTTSTGSISGWLISFPDS